MLVLNSVIGALRCTEQLYVLGFLFGIFLKGRTDCIVKQATKRNLWQRNDKGKQQLCCFKPFSFAVSVFEVGCSNVKSSGDYNDKFQNYITKYNNQRIAYGG